MAADSPTLENATKTAHASDQNCSKTTAAVLARRGSPKPLSKLLTLSGFYGVLSQ
jgi:hypothetical protein